MSELKKEDMNIVIVGHVDHGKSTLIGRLLADTNSLPLGKLEQVKEKCRKNSKPFEYAFLLDALKDEQAQGITIDTARCFFKTQKRNYIILDAPGHIEFLKNMITGASRAEAALLVIDANEGVKENSKRHGYMLSMLGIKQIVVAINKMDLVNYSKDVFEKVKDEYTEFLSCLGLNPKCVIPISAFEGDNIVQKSENMKWYQGLTILEVLDCFQCEQTKIDKVFRMPVQDIYKFTENNDNRRIAAGTIVSGILKKGDKVVFYPSGKKSTVKNIESFPEKNIEQVSADMAVGVTLEEQIYIKRGEIMTIDGQDPTSVSSKIKVNLFWLGLENMILDKKYILKIGTAKVNVTLQEIINVMNSSDLSVEKRDFIRCNEVAECILKTDKPIAYDSVEKLAETSRFVIVDNFEISGGGIILSSVQDNQSHLRNTVIKRNYKWESSEIGSELRAERYCQKSIMLIFTGEKGVGKKELAKAFEKSLIEMGRIAYYLGIGTFLYGVDADIKQFDKGYHEEHIRRFAEVANIMLDSGMILNVSIRSLTKDDLDIMKTVINGDIEVIWIGDKPKDSIEIDTYIKEINKEQDIFLLKNKLRKRGIIFNV